LSDRQLAVIGCGLMGGSFALAAREAGLAQRIVGYGRSIAPLQWAMKHGVIDEVASSAATAVAGADLVLVAVPVAAIGDTFAAIRDALAPDALLMDVGSTKRQVIADARGALAQRLPNFVPAHPIAGKERAGVQQADAQLYRGRQVILTPIAETAPEQLDRARRLWAALGAQVREMTPEGHDAGYAAVSHFPHLLAFAYFSGLLSQADRDRYLALAGPGFRDFTRIAASDPTVWRDILVSNGDELIAQSAHFRQALAEFERAVQQRDGAALERLVRTASEARAAWRMSGDASPPSS
jgi:prephenate dehydrogenase